MLEIILAVGGVLGLVGGLLVIFPRLRCFIWHQERMLQKFASDGGPTIYCVMCVRCRRARCHIDGQRLGLPNDSYRSAVHRAERWLKYKTGKPVSYPFVELN